MKLKLTILLILLIQPIFAFSQNTLTITSDQLKTSNLIFLEHEKLLKINKLLESKTTNLEFINKALIEQDSINKINIYKSNYIIEEKNILIDDLNKKIKTKQKVINYGSLGTIFLLILCLI